jgi:hypothetical protein
MDNCGLRHVVLRRDPQDPSLWRILARVRNYGRRPQFRRLRLAFGGSPAGEAVLSLPPDSEHEAAFSLRTQAAGWLELRLSGRDALADDDAAVLELPALRPIRLLAYTRQPESLRPLLGFASSSVLPRPTILSRQPMSSCWTSSARPSFHESTRCGWTRLRIERRPPFAEASLKRG